MLRTFQRTARVLAMGATLAGTAGAAGLGVADDFFPPARHGFSSPIDSIECRTDSKEQPGANAPETTDPSAASTLDDPGESGDLGGFGRSYLSTGIAVAGSGLASASATGGPGTSFGTPGPAVNVPNSAISPGFLTSATVQPTLPMNRVFGGYSYFDQFQVQTLTLIDNGSNNPNPIVLAGHRAGFNLNYFNVGVEKTIFNGHASVYVSVPFLSASDNTTGQDGVATGQTRISTGQNVNGIGNVNFGFKALLLQSDDCRHALSAGLTVAAPTGNATQVATTQVYNAVGGPGTAYQFSPTNSGTTFSTVNPTFIQPWISGMISGDRFFAQNYFGVLIPTPSDFVTSVNENLSLGYKLWSSADSFSISPILNTQVLVPLNGSGISFSTQTFITEGVQIGLGQRTSVFAGVVEPVSGPGAFTVGGTFGFNYLY